MDVGTIEEVQAWPLDCRGMGPLTSLSIPIVHIPARRPVIIMIQSNHKFTRICEVDIQPYFLKRPAFATNADRVARRMELDAAIALIFASMMVDVDGTQFQQAGIARGDILKC